jgi:hypothetical protein
MGLSRQRHGAANGYTVTSIDISPSGHVEAEANLTASSYGAWLTDKSQPALFAVDVNIGQTISEPYAANSLYAR